MKGILTMLLVVCMLSAYGQKNKIEWNEFYKLTWYDFQGKAAEGSRGDAGAVVQIKAKPYYVGKEIHYDVYAYFNRRKSWKKDISDQLLAHEQLHFDIAELYARKIRRQIEILKRQGANDSKSINKEIKKLLNESNSYDELYDLETLHGSLQKKQASWSRKISEELEELEDYKKERKIISRNRR